MLQALRDELARQIIRATVVGEGRLETAIPGLYLSRRTQPTQPLNATYEPSVAIGVQGRKRINLGASSFIYDSTHFLLTALDLPVIGQVFEASPTEPFLCMLVKLDMTVVREMILTATRPKEPATLAMSMGKLTPAILQPCIRLMELINDSPGDIPALAPLAQRELVYRLLQSEAGARLHAIATQGDQSNRTSRAVAWIRENYTKPLRMEDLADIAGMGVSTLHHHFRALTSMSPLQYQKQLRLQAARSRMLTEGLDAASAAFTVGYESATQFSREYSRFFGQPPVRDTRALRTTTSQTQEATHA
ncbi:AraC family transcriptional regulator [Bryobacterales bacterium F-183]|nr:AraC family transcriptional regulator [Bryobacterales bacterium F-183]